MVLLHVTVWDRKVVSLTFFPFVTEMQTDAE